MPKRFRPGIIVLALFAVCLCGVLGYAALRRLRPSNDISKLMTFAGELGYRQEAQVSQYGMCWGVFLTECGQFLYYSTDLRLEQFQAELARAAPAAGIPKIVDGYTLLDINQATRQTLSIDGKTESLDRTAIPEPTAYGWLDTEGGGHWVIRFYETAQDGHVYKIDDRPIVGNIVMIMLQTR
jgi:hypothetical protein